MSQPPLLVSNSDAVATLTLNRPDSKNALNRELVVALGNALQNVAQDPAVRAVVLAGAGESFCSGADLKSALSETDVNMEQRLDEFHVLIRAIVSAPKPFVAAIDGPAVGFGADLALACDLRVMSTRAYLQEKFVKIGLMPDGGGTFWLPRLVGLGRAMEMLLLGSKIEAELALSLGLTNRVVGPDSMLSTAQALASELAKGPPLALAQIRHSVRESFRGSIEDALTREKSGQLRLLASEDMMEGVQAWAQRREPKFQGK
ncbi:MAG TPA: enoyl-CoA hydratase [Polyangiaceae bacterium]|nr:enoyl-CoA hydratase [Polyangiaceae bacterium]HMR77529.1 enoyl-CoA hydratase [Polyangiaceae bacterium]